MNIPTKVDGPTVNFISKGVDQEDKDLFFGPVDPDEYFIIIEDHWTMAHILHGAGIFPSVSQAKKQGGNAEIPRGFSMVTRGKKQNKKHIFVLKL
jgi:hypothetical protein